MFTCQGVFFDWLFSHLIRNLAACDLPEVKRALRLLFKLSYDSHQIWRIVTLYKQIPSECLTTFYHCMLYVDSCLTTPLVSRICCKDLLTVLVGSLGSTNVYDMCPVGLSRYLDLHGKDDERLESVDVIRDLFSCHRTELVYISLMNALGTNHRSVGASLFPYDIAPRQPSWLGHVHLDAQALYTEVCLRHPHLLSTSTIKCLLHVDMERLGPSVLKILLSYAKRYESLIHSSRMAHVSQLSPILRALPLELVKDNMDLLCTSFSRLKVDIAFVASIRDLVDDKCARRLRSPSDFVGYCLLLDDLSYEELWGIDDLVRDLVLEDSYHPDLEACMFILNERAPIHPLESGLLVALWEHLLVGKCFDVDLSHLQYVYLELLSSQRPVPELVPKLVGIARDAFITWMYDDHSTHCLTVLVNWGMELPELMHDHLRNNRNTGAILGLMGKCRQDTFHSCISALVERVQSGFSLEVVSYSPDRFAVLVPFAKEAIIAGDRFAANLLLCLSSREIDETVLLCGERVFQDMGPVVLSQTACALYKKFGQRFFPLAIQACVDMLDPREVVKIVEALDPIAYRKALINILETWHVVHPSIVDMANRAGIDSMLTGEAQMLQRTKVAESG